MRELLRRRKCGTIVRCLKVAMASTSSAITLGNKRMHLLGHASLTTVREEPRMPGPAMARTYPEMKQADPDVRCSFTTLKPVETCVAEMAAIVWPACVWQLGTAGRRPWRNAAARGSWRSRGRRGTASRIIPGQYGGGLRGF